MVGGKQLGKTMHSFPVFVFGIQKDVVFSSFSITVSLKCQRKRNGIDNRGSGPAVSEEEELEKMRAATCIVGSGPAVHTTTIYTARAELKPILFKGWMTNRITPGDQLMTTTDVENFSSFPQGIMGMDLTEKFKEQSVCFGTRVFTEIVVRLDLSVRPFRVYTDTKQVDVDIVVIATGAVAKRLDFLGAGEGEDGFWHKGISTCIVCDGAAPIFRNRPLAMIGGGDSAMEEANFLTKYGSKVYIIQRQDAFRASTIMQKSTLDKPKIEVIWNTKVLKDSGEEELLCHELSSFLPMEGHLFEQSNFELVKRKKRVLSACNKAYKLQKSVVEML